MSSVRYEACTYAGCGAARGEDCKTGGPGAERVRKSVHAGRVKVGPRYTKQVVVTVRPIVHARVERMHLAYGDSQAEVLRQCIDAGIERVEAEYAARAAREAELSVAPSIAS